MRTTVKISIFPLVLVLIWAIYRFLPMSFYGNCPTYWLNKLFNSQTEITFLFVCVIAIYGIIISFIYLPKIISWIIFLLGIIAIYFFLSMSSARIFSPEARTISSMKSIQLGLDLYKGELGFYPQSLHQLVPKYFSTLPKEEPTKKDFEYHVSGDFRSYVLKSNVFDSCLVTASLKELALKNDYDGTILGANCDDPSYCVTGN